MIIVSNIARNKEKCYLEVGGKPFLYQTVQSWYPPEADYSIYMEKAREVHYRCFAFWMYWKHLEPQPGRYNWTELDRVIDLANQYDMYLDMVWAGVNFCGHMDPRFTPVWIIQEDKYHAKNEYGYPIYTDGGDAGFCFVADYNNEELLSLEQRFLCAMLDHLRDYDKNRRLIFIQVENEINMTKWTGGKSEMLRYINQVAKVIKEHPYQIATRVNIFAYRDENFEMDPDIDLLEYVDGHGLDTYSSDVSTTRKAVTSTGNTKFSYIAENEAFPNTTAHIIAALSNGGFYNVYKVDYDYIHKKDGIFGSDFSYTSLTYRLKNLNQSLNKIGELIAQASKEDCAEFNTANSEMPNVLHKETKVFLDKRITFHCQNGSVAMAVKKDEAIYFIADDECEVEITSCIECSVGAFVDGNWIEEECFDAKKQIHFYKGQCLRFI